MDQKINSVNLSDLKIRKSGKDGVSAGSHKAE